MMQTQIKTLALLVLVHAFSIYASQTVITQSGTHILDTSRSYAPSTPNDTIIEVAANNVILDFKGKAIDQRSDNTQPGLDGITLSTAVSEVTIKNAHIKNLTGVGIRVSNACNKISILDSKLESCDAGGIVLNGTTPGVIGVDIQNCTILTCTGYGGEPAYGIRVIKGDTVIVDDCRIASNDAVTTSSGFGISIENSQQCAVLNTSIGKTGGSGIAAGIAVIASDETTLQNVAVQKTIAYSGTAYGFWIEQCSNILSVNCRSAVNSSNSFPCYGYALRNGQKNVIEGLIAGFNTSTASTAGILLNNENQSIISRSTSRGNNTTSSGTAYGILMTGTCDQCSLDTNKIINNKGASSTFGIQDQRSPSTSIILGNLAFNNGNNFNIIYPFGATLPITESSLSIFPGTTNINTSNVYMNVSVTP